MVRKPSVTEAERLVCSAIAGTEASRMPAMTVAANLFKLPPFGRRFRQAIRFFGIAAPVTAT